MGIKGLTSLINKEAADAIHIHSLKYFKGSKIAIDTSILLYKFRHSNNSENSHISGLLNKCLNFIKYGIIPVFIIDGKPPEEKRETINNRNNQREKLENKISELKKQLEENPEENCKEDLIYKINKLNKQIIRVTKEHHKEAHDLLNILGFSVIKSPGEAESVCAFLQKENIVNFTYSDDTDLLPLGCEKLLRSNGKTNTLIEINLEKTLSCLDVTFEQFIDLCILCGCDYTQNIPKINHEKALKLIREHKNIENVCKYLKEDGYIIPDGFNYEDARRIFKTENSRITSLSNTDKFIVNIKEDTPTIDIKKFYNFLLDKNYNKYFINKYIKKFNNAKLLIPKNSKESLILNFKM